MSNLCIVGLQWGDEGKGKIVDYYADRFRAVVRYNGGSNAGHTIVINGRTFVFHLLPSGSLKSKKLLIGPGVALDPLILEDELTMLAKEGGQADLTVDARCTLVTPLEKEMDSFIEGLRGAEAIGTTKRGIGPSYAMRALRLTPRAGDLANGEFDLSSAVSFYRSFLKEIPDLGPWKERAKRVLAGRTGDVGGQVMALNEAGHSVMFEGAQGTLLDLAFGTYPYVTGSHTLASYVPAGLGIPASALGDVMGVAKAYTTRVGGGPFPTEDKEEVGERIRREGKEYGATTGRPRRVGWLDLVALKYAVKLNGARAVAISKMDVLANVKESKVCVAYRLNGSELGDFQKSLGHLDEVEPVYQSKYSLYGAEFGRTLPAQAKRLIDYLEDELRVKVKMVSYGEERSRTIEL